MTVPNNPKAQELTLRFGSSTGTSRYFNSTFLDFVVHTDGIEDMARELQCYWVIDLIASHNIYPKFREQLIQLWQIVSLNNVASAYCNGELVQDLEFTTLYDGKLTIKAVWNGDKLILCLPIED